MAFRSEGSERGSNIEKSSVAKLTTSSSAINGMVVSVQLVSAHDNGHGQYMTFCSSEHRAKTEDYESWKR